MPIMPTDPQSTTRSVGKVERGQRTAQPGVNRQDGSLRPIVTLSAQAGAPFDISFRKCTDLPRSCKLSVAQGSIRSRATLRRRAAERDKMQFDMLRRASDLRSFDGPENRSKGITKQHRPALIKGSRLWLAKMDRKEALLINQDKNPM